MSTKTLYLKELPYIEDQVMIVGNDFESDTFAFLDDLGDPLPLTGYVIVATMRLADGSEVALTIARDDLAGEFYVTHPRATTAGYGEQQATYWIDIADPVDDMLHTYCGGAMTIKDVKDGDQNG